MHTAYVHTSTRVHICSLARNSGNSTLQYITTVLQQHLGACMHTKIGAYIQANIRTVICTYRPVHTYMHTCMHTPMHEYKPECTHAHKQTYCFYCIQTCIHTYLHAYVGMYTYLFSYLHTYLPTFIYIQTHSMRTNVSTYVPYC